MTSLCTLASTRTLVECQRKSNHGGDRRSLLNQAGKKGQIKMRECAEEKKLGRDGTPRNLSGGMDLVNRMWQTNSWKPVDRLWVVHRGNPRQVRTSEGMYEKQEDIVIEGMPVI